jgi:NAD(P)-dependent dehydrogenase (short-subunit alcohol dehydrogenase family)
VQELAYPLLRQAHHEHVSILEAITRREGAREERGRANTPLQMALEPDDLAGTYAFLASRTNAKGITGTIVTVDAGVILRMPRRSEPASGSF